VFRTTKHTSRGKASCRHASSAKRQDVYTLEVPYPSSSTWRFFGLTLSETPAVSALGMELCIALFAKFFYSQTTPGANSVGGETE
jgi:hypothetical protein